MNPLIIIPTFVFQRRGSTATDSLMTTYDHVTSLNAVGELPRLLESLQKIQGANRICILVASDANIASQAAAKVHTVASRFPGLNVLVVGGEELLLIRRRLTELGAGDVSQEIGLTGYGAIRNLGLVVACTLGYDAALFLDDDEVITDPAFLEKGVYGLGKLTKRGIPIIAKTGFYYNSEGSYLSKSQNKWYNHFWQQGKAFNQWIEGAMNGPRLSRSNHVCGGCLILHREAFRRVCFDPWIPRGEDLDYMLNLRMYGADIWFDNQWNLKHLPPNTTSEGRRFRQDIFRWLYEYRKVEYSRSQIDLLQIKPASLEPYPGPFLEPGIMRRIKWTATLRSWGRPDKAAYREAAKVASTEADTYASQHCSKYFEFQHIWPELMNRVENDQALQQALVASARWRRGEEAPTGIDPGMTSEIHLNIAE